MKEIITTEGLWKIAGILIIIMIVSFCISIIQMPNDFRSGVYTQIIEYQVQLAREHASLTSQMNILGEQCRHVSKCSKVIGACHQEGDNCCEERNFSYLSEKPSKDNDQPQGRAIPLPPVEHKSTYSPLSM